jgi:hypothetical protein
LLAGDAWLGQRNGCFSPGLLGHLVLIAAARQLEIILKNKLRYGVRSILE